MSVLRAGPELRSGPGLDEVLGLLAERRTLDLSDLPPAEQAALIAARGAELVPSSGELASLLAAARAEGRRLTVKFGIDPTAADVHVGHTVPMLVASRFQRMGHRVVFIVGDITATIGDPSGRVSGRPPLTTEDVRANMATYRHQIGTCFDFDRADFRFNSEWLSAVTLPEFLAVLAKLPVAATLRREDFRSRLGAGSGLTMAELAYAVVVALDSVKVGADVELGGVDQLLNLQMGRQVMANAGLRPQVIIGVGLIEGTDGSGAKMSKSLGNYIGLAFAPRDVFGGLMSIPDRLIPQYLRALTELLDPEIELLLGLVSEGRAHPMGIKTLLAADVTGAVHGRDAATASRDAFAARFSRRRFSETDDVPVLRAADHGGAAVAALFAMVTGSVPSISEVRRAARGGGLRLVTETPEPRPPRSVTLSETDAAGPLSVLLTAHDQAVRQPGARVFLKCGRSLLEIVPGQPGDVR